MATIILAHEHKEPLDSIVFSEVMFDLKNNISGENPRHMKFIREKAVPLFESWGYKVEIVREGVVRRAKLYYLRDRVGKAAKVKAKYN